MKILGGLLDRILAVIGALIFAQLPMFMLQYTQQIAGRAAEVGLQLNAIQHIASLNGKSMPEYIHKFTASTDPDFLRQGELMEKMMDRFTYLSNAEIGISTASAFAKPFVFFRHFDTEIAKTTYAHFSFGIPLSIEGLVYAFAGLILGCLVFYFFSRSGKYIYQTLRSSLRRFPEKI